MRRHTRHFVRLYLTWLGCLLAGLVLFNMLADPYNTYPAVHLDALMPHKPNNDHRRAKAGLVRQEPGWDTVILGSSYAVVGMDATHTALGEGRAFNLGLNGGKLEEQLGALHYVWRYGHPIKRIILVYDNQWFIQAASPSIDYLQSPFNTDYSYIEYQGSNLLGMQATEHAWHAVRQWWQDGPATDDPFGRRLTPLIPTGKPQRLIFDDYLSTPDLSRPTDGDAANLELFKKFARFCLEREIALTVLIAPAHVSLLEKFDASGYWPDWLAGQRRLVELAETLNLQHPDALPVMIWSFNGITAYTNEPIPSLDDTTTRLKWFWDPGHFRKELGDLMLQRTFGAEDQTEALFGVRLAPESIERYLSDLRDDYEKYAQSQSR